VLGCIGFAVARSFGQLVVARLMIGLGVSASLMAPLAAFMRMYERPIQLRLNSWMLMSGSLGMVASTLPVQMLLPVAGWRGLFWAVAAALAIGMIGVAVATPADPPPQRPHEGGGYRFIVTHPSERSSWLNCETIALSSRFLTRPCSKAAKRQSVQRPCRSYRRWLERWWNSIGKSRCGDIPTMYLSERLNFLRTGNSPLPGL